MADLTFLCPGSEQVLTRIAKWLRYRGLPADKRAVLERYDEAVRNFERSTANSCTLSATCEFGAIPLMTDRHPERWTRGSRDAQYERLRELVEQLGSPLKRELTEKGFNEENIKPSLTFGLKLTEQDEILEVEGGTWALDYDPVDARRAADAYHSGQHGFDRMLTWDHVFTLSGRVHGYFLGDESSRFRDAWQRKHGAPLPQTEWLLLARLTVKIHASP